MKNSIFSFKACGHYIICTLYFSLNNDILIHHWGTLIIRQRVYNCFLIRPSDFIADCCVQARCKRHNIDWLAVEQSTLSSSEPGCNTQRLRHMIYWKPTDRRIRMTSHPGLRNPADAQDVFAFLHHLTKTKELAFFILQRIQYWNEIFQYYF